MPMPVIDMQKRLIHVKKQSIRCVIDEKKKMTIDENMNSEDGNRKKESL